MFYRVHTTSFRASVLFSLLAIAPATSSAQSSETARLTDVSNIAVKKNIRQATISEPENTGTETVERFERELLAAPGDAVLYNNLGVVHARRQNYDKAAAALEKAVSLKPAFVDALYNLSIVYEIQERFAESLEVIRRASALDDANVAVRAQLCQIELSSELFREAVPCYEALLKTSPPELRTRLGYGIALTRSGENGKALPVLRENVALYPNEAVTHNALGMLLFVKKNYKQALACFSRAVELNPGFEPARYNLALTQIMTNDRASAIRQYAQLKNSNPSLATALYKALYRDKLIFIGK